MTIRVAINGFGRIGRLVLRALIESGRSDLTFVAINDLGSPADNAYLLKYDSVHGTLPQSVTADGDLIKVEGLAPIKVLSERDPAKLPWKELGIDVALECTGLFTKREKAAAHLAAGAKRVLISGPSGDADMTVVYKVNHDKLTPDLKVVSNGSCTTNCLGPVLKVLNDLAGVAHGYMTTVHSYTGDQRAVDTLHRDRRRGRTIGTSIIPTSTGAAKAIGLVIPELAGKLDGTSLRVPTPDVSVIDLKVVAKRSVTKEEVNQAVIAAAKGPMQGVLVTNEEQLVSVDFRHNPASAIFDLTQTTVIEGTFVRVLAWYDNEWGFSNRMLDIAKIMGGFG